MNNFVSLFSGCGGFDSGFIKAGYKCLGAFDNDPIAIDNYLSNIGPWIQNVDLSCNQPLPINKSNGVDVVISGSPCQGYSTLGKRKIDDPRNKLLIKGGEIAVALNAKVFIAENVIGSTAGNHQLYWDLLIKLLKKNQYSVQVKILNSFDFGIAQTRKRVFLFAWKGKDTFNINIEKSESKFLKDVICNLNGAANNYGEIIDKNDDRKIICDRILPGQKLCDVRGGERSVHSWDIPEYFGQCNSKEIEILEFIKQKRRQVRRRDYGDADPVSINLLINQFGSNYSENIKELIVKKYLVEKETGFIDLARSFNGKFRRLEWNKPSLTVDTNFGNPNYFLHPTENRGFTVRESARIQGFDDNYIFKGNIKHQFKLIGNAVPPPLAYKISKYIAKNILSIL